jgi:hypothetical protein
MSGAESPSHQIDGFGKVLLKGLEPFCRRASHVEEWKAGAAQAEDQPDHERGELRSNHRQDQAEQNAGHHQCADTDAHARAGDQLV